MKVAIVYQYFQGHGAPGHSSIYELAHHLSERGHDISVVAGESGYMKRAHAQLPWYRRLLRRERDGRVMIVRTFAYTQLHRSYLGRLWSFASFSLSCPFGLLACGRPDVIVASSPPIFPMVTAWALARARGIPFVFEVRDLWPASAVQMGIVSSRALIGVMAWIERFLYTRADRIVALTEGIRDDIVARGWPRGKIEVVTAGVDETQLYPDPGAGKALRERLGWADRRVVLYFGALGEANNIGVTLRAARALRDDPSVLFVLVGDGMKRAEIEHTIAEQGLSNVLLLPPVPKQEARAYINAADLCLVTLRDIPLFDGAIPTKLIDYMACGRPVLCGVRGEARRIVEQADAGRVFEPDDEQELVGAIAALGDPDVPLAAMGARALAFVRTHYCALTMRSRMERLLQSVAGEPVTAGGHEAGDPAVRPDSDTGAGGR
ncbi:MAG: glycosyltransferase family 4 protein [Burkholderiaceae bacterium]